MHFLNLDPLLYSIAPTAALALSAKPNERHGETSKFVKRSTGCLTRRTVVEINGLQYTSAPLSYNT